MTLALSLCVRLHAVSPPDASDLVIDLDASTLSLSNGDSVTAWDDSSGNGNVFTPAGTGDPTYVSDGIGGQPAVSFDGSNFLYSNTYITLSPGFTYFAVYTTGQTSPIYTGDGFPQPGGTIIGQSSANNVEYGVASGVQNVETYTGAWNTTSGAVPVADGTTQVGSLTIAGDGTTNLYVNGVLDGTSSNGPLTDGSAGVDRIGAGESDHVYSFFDGDIAQVLVYSTVLDATQMAEVNTYLDTKYDVAAIPEPTTLTLVLVGMGGLLALGRRKSGQNPA